MLQEFLYFIYITYPFGHEVLHAFGHPVGVLGQVFGADPGLLTRLTLEIGFRELEKTDLTTPLFAQVSQELPVHHVLHDKQVRF